MKGDQCTAKQPDCVSKNKVDVGLARWCAKWPAPKPKKADADAPAAKE